MYYDCRYTYSVIVFLGDALSDFPKYGYSPGYFDANSEHVTLSADLDTDVITTNARLRAQRDELLAALQVLTRLAADDEFEPRSAAGRAALDAAFAAVPKG